MHIPQNKIHLIYPFQYVSQPDDFSENLTKDQLFEFLPYVKNFFTKSHKNIRIKNIKIQKDITLHTGKSKNEQLTELYFEEAKIFFFQSNIAMLVLKLSIKEHFDFQNSREILTHTLKHLSTLSNNNSSKIVSCIPSRIVNKIPLTENMHKHCNGKVNIIPLVEEEKLIVRDFRIKTVENNLAINKAIEENRKQYNVHVERALSISAWVESLISPYIDTFDNSNFLNISYLNIFTLSLAPKDDTQKNNFIDASLLHYDYLKNDINESKSHTGIKKLAYSRNINVYANLNGALILADDTAYNKDTFFNHFSHNILLIYLFVLLQKSILITLINNTDRELDNIGKKDSQTYKDTILNYLIHIDFTQLSNNPVRNEIYKFFRETHLIKDLLSEIKLIVDNYDNQKQKEDERRTSNRFMWFEITIAIIGVLQLISEWDQISKFVNSLFSFLGHIVYT